jgi:hypothetical protein
MAKKRTTVYVSEDLLELLNIYMEESGETLTDLFDNFLRSTLGIEKDPSVSERVKSLEQKVEKIESRLGD